MIISHSERAAGQGRAAGIVVAISPSHILFGQNPRTTFANTISNGTLKLDGGTWTLLAANSFSGGLFLLDHATLDFSKDENLGAAGATLTFQGGILRPSTSIGTSRPISTSSFGGTFDTNGQTLTITGTVSGGGPVTKTGDGTLIFSGAGKSLGTATVAQGVLRIDNNGTSGVMSVTVRDGGTFGGNGSASSVTLTAGGHLAPGTETPGSLLFNSHLSLSRDSVLDFDLGPTLFDQIILRQEHWTNKTRPVQCWSISSTPAGSQLARLTR